MADINALINAQIREVEIVMNFAAGNVKRLTNNILRESLQTDQAGIVNQMFTDLSDYMLAVTAATESPQFAESTQAIIDTIGQMADQMVADWEQQFGPIDQNTQAQIDAMVQEREFEIGNNISSDQIRTNLEATTTQAGGLYDQVYHMVGQQRYTVDEIVARAGDEITGAYQKYGANRILTPMQIFARDVLTLLEQATSDQLSGFYRYAGPNDEVTREFCAQYANGIYHEREIAMWPMENGFEWDGMIPSTNEETIFNNAGGFNCRHVFEPVPSSSVPTDVVARVREKGFIQ